jgi:hypothetical protein
MKTCVVGTRCCEWCGGALTQEENKARWFHQGAMTGEPTIPQMAWRGDWVPFLIKFSIRLLFHVLFLYLKTHSDTSIRYVM